MKKLLVIILVLAMFTSVAYAGKPEEGTRIKDQELMYADGHYLDEEYLPFGYDIFGYNYQAHMFNGTTANVYLGKAGFSPYLGDDESYLAENPTAVNHWAWPYRNNELIMKWNDAWLSNMDRDDDGNLDRHHGFDSYIGSGAWLTNHEVYYEDDVLIEYFVKIVAAPADAYTDDGYWYTVDHVEIGPVIWGAFAIIQEEENGVPIYESKFRTGLGNW